MLRKIAEGGEPRQSVRFLGRNMLGLVIVLITVMIHRLRPARVRRILGSIAD